MNGAMDWLNTLEMPVPMRAGLQTNGISGFPTFEVENRNKK